MMQLYDWEIARLTISAGFSPGRAHKALFFLENQRSEELTLKLKKVLYVSD